MESRRRCYLRDTASVRKGVAGDVWREEMGDRKRTAEIETKQASNVSECVRERDGGREGAAERVRESEREHSERRKEREK